MKRVGRVVLWCVAGLSILVGLVWAVGTMLPAEHSVSVSREVAGSQTRVWSVLSEPGRYAEWRPDVQSVTVTSYREGLPRSWRETTAEGTITYRTVEADAPRRLVVEIADEGLPYGGRWTYGLQPDREGTRVTITEDGIVRDPFFRFFSRFVFGHESTARDFLESLDAHMAGRGD